MSENGTHKNSFGGGARVFCFLFGLYLLFGAAITIYDGKLFAGFPPQLDIASFLFGWSSVGAYVEAALAAVLGLLLVAGALAGGKEDAP